MLKQYHRYQKRFSSAPTSRKLPVILVAVMVAFIGVSLLYAGIAATFATSNEAENGTLAGNAKVNNGTNASNGQYVKFGGACTVSAILVNSCRPLVGAVAKGNPGTPTEIANGTAPSNDFFAQFNYLEGLLGNNLDIFRTYHGGAGDFAFNPSTLEGKAEIHFANRPGTYVALNWDPNDWPHSSGSDASVNNLIDQTAANIKAVAPHKVFLSLWHEANLHVSAKDTTNQNCNNLDTGYLPDGTPNQFVAAWHNIQNRFKAAGVTNVIWVWGLGSDPADTCWLQYMWPGNSNVDWVNYDTYGRPNKQTWAETSGAFYDFLQTNSTATNDWNSKPWGIGEFGDSEAPTQQDAYNYFNEITSDAQTNTYPRLKMYQYFALFNSATSGGVLTDYDAGANNSLGVYDAKKQQVINNMFNTMLNL